MDIFLSSNPKGNFPNPPHFMKKINYSQIGFSMNKTSKNRIAVKIPVLS